MNTNTDPVVTRFIQLTAYFIWRLTDQPSTLVIRTIREHPRYKNTVLFREMDSDHVTLMDKAIADTFGTMLLSPPYQQSETRTRDVLKDHAILMARQLGLNNSVLGLEKGDPILMSQLAISSKVVHKCFGRLTPWLTKILTEIPKQFTATELQADMSQDYWLVEKKFWSMAKAIMRDVPGFMEFFVTEYGNFLVDSIESHLNMLEVYEPGILDRTTMPSMVNQIYQLGVADLMKNLR